MKSFPKSKVKQILTIGFGCLMILAGAMHFAKPAIYDPLIPDFLPKLFVNYVTGVTEIILGACTITKPCRRWGTLGIFWLMIAFFPLHVVDAFRDTPAIGSLQAALIRLPLQLVLILWARYIRN